MRSTLEKLKRGTISVEEAAHELRTSILAVHDLARLDVNRASRTGIPEIVIAEGKDADHLYEIAHTYLCARGHVIISRLDPTVYDHLSARGLELDYQRLARVGVACRDGHEPEPTGATIGILSAGTSDIGVAEEARIVAEALGATVHSVHDIGVAGVHRLPRALSELAEKRIDIDVYIVAAGREGALPTLVAGLVDAPVIGLPVSTGYGMAGKGKAALYGMLQSCTPLVVVNIDAGTIAGAVAAQIANKIANARRAAQ